jgi:tetratricopeptide (TPR) repeat protein
LRMEVLSFQSAVRSPDRGQYGFMQDLVRSVAYETLSRRDRKVLHVAAAEWLEGNRGAEDPEIVEVLASHFLEAYRLAPDDADAGAVRDRASGVLVRAAAHAAGLAATAEAQNYYEQAIAMVDSPQAQAELHEQAGAMAWTRGQREEASAHFAIAIALFQDAQLSHAAARVVARLGEAEASGGALTQALERMEGAYAVLAADPPDADLAALAAQLARWHALVGAFDLSAQRARVAVNVAEAVQRPDLISHALNTQASIALSRGNREESLALYTHALKIALDHDIPTAALRAYNNVASLHASTDNWVDSLRMASEGLVLARRMGERLWEYMLIGEASVALFVTGGWDEALAMLEPLSREATHGLSDLSNIVGASVLFDLYRGNLSACETRLDAVSFLAGYPDSQARSMYWASRAPVLHASGRLSEAVDAGRKGMDDQVSTVPSPWIKQGFATATAAALEMGDRGTVEELLAWVDGCRPDGNHLGSSPKRRAFAPGWLASQDSRRRWTASTRVPSSCSPACRPPFGPQRRVWSGRSCSATAVPLPRRPHSLPRQRQHCGRCTPFPGWTASARWRLRSRQRRSRILEAAGQDPDPRRPADTAHTVTPS